MNLFGMVLLFLSAFAFTMSIPGKFYVTQQLVWNGLSSKKEFNVNAMTGNNRAHRSPSYGPEIQKQPLFLSKPRETKLPADPYIGPVFFRVIPSISRGHCSPC